MPHTQVAHARSCVRAYVRISQYVLIQDERVQALIRSNSWGLVLSVPFYAQLMTFYGALRGANYQLPGILGTIVGYWIVGLPLGGLCGCVWHWPTPLTGVNKDL